MIGAPTGFSLGRLPRIAFGPGAISQVPAIVARLGARALLVTGQGSFARSGRASGLESGLIGTGVTLVGRVAVTAEPGPDVIDEAVRVWRGAGVQVVLGIGGGSALDAAKAIAGLLPSGDSVRVHLEGFPGQRPYHGPAVPVVAVPTTAGTGSEATRNAVISVRGPEGFKRSFRDERLVPADAVVDPDLLAGLHPDAIAFNGLDALTQLMEAYVSTRASPVTDALVLDGLAAIGDGLAAWHRDPDAPGAPEARARTAYAALLSGICLANAGLGAVHGLAAPLGGLLPIPHGAACGAVLWQTTRATIEALEEREPGHPALARYAQLGRLLAGVADGAPGGASDGTSGGEFGRAPDGTSGRAARAGLVDWLRATVATLGAPGLGAFGMVEADVPGLVEGSRGSSMRTHPVTLTDDELAAILRASA